MSDSSEPPPGRGGGPDWDAIGRELIGMAREDERVRAELAADLSLYKGYHPRMRAVHDRHASRLAEILAQHGWPGEAATGAAAAEAAWLIVQHAIAQPALQRRALHALQAAVARGHAPAWQAAMLEDRIRTLEGRLQRYGTQSDWDAGGRLSPLPLDEPETVDQRRAAVGLPPLQQAIRDQRLAAERSGEQPPGDWAARQQEMEEWLREVGWRSR